MDHNLEPERVDQAFRRLTLKHKRFLQEKYAHVLAKKPKPKTALERFMRMAKQIGDSGVAKYAGLYPRKPSRFVSLYTPVNEARNAAWFLERLRSRFADIAIPIGPDLSDNTPPTFNGVRVFNDGSLELDFVSLSPEKLKMVGYGTVESIQDIRHDYVVVDGGKPVIEIATLTTPEHRDDVLNAFCNALGLVKNDFSLRAFDAPHQWKTLQAALSAYINGHGGNQRGRGKPVAYAMHAPRGERLDDLEKWKVLDIKHDEARELTFGFSLPSDIDDYPEDVYYNLKLATGEIKFPDDTSEAARRKVIDEYLEIV